MSVKEKIVNLLKEADITVGGNKPQDIQIHDERLYKRIIKDGSLGVGEAYMEGWWDANNLDQFIAHAIRNNIGDLIMSSGLLLNVVLARVFNLQSVHRAFMVGEKHYDAHDDVYEAMLDESMTYSCGYYGRGATTLEQAQNDKYKLICEKLDIKAGSTVLDIGCGWGGFSIYVAKHYGANVTGVTVSKEQLKIAQKRAEGLPIEFRLQDYRALKDVQFDNIVSIGMFEHVGYKNYPEFMKVTKKLLKPDGKILLHTIGSSVSVTNGDPWFDKYIFQNGMLPSIKQISSAAENNFVIEDLHNFGADYDITLMEWWKNFDKAWKDGLSKEYDERFYRMWKFYILTCAGIFRIRYIQLWQLVFSHNGVPGGYKSVR